MTLQLIFSIRGFNRLTAFATGAAGGFAFTNPDVDNARCPVCLLQEECGESRRGLMPLPGHRYCYVLF
eukprot:s5005_g3.t1